MDLEPGSTFGPYRIVAPLGSGGMAVVYRAHDPALDRDVALKLLPAEFLHDPAFADRFRQEARVAARLEHPHIVPIHAYGIEAGRPWMALRLLPGGSLADRVRHRALAASEAAALVRDVAEALDYAHARGVVHRDVKPANVLLDDAGRAYLADFGIARMLEGSTVATATGLIQGSPSYMAPEQAMGEKVGPPADVYALAVMAFECLTGRVPYTGTTPVAILMKHVQEPVPEPPASELAPPLAAVVRRGLAKAPAARWPSAGAFALALGEAAAAQPPGSAPEALPTLDLPPPAATAERESAPSRPPASRITRSVLWAAAGGLVGLSLLAAGGLVARRWLPTPTLEAPSPAPSVATTAPTASASPAAPLDTLPLAPTATPRPRPRATPRATPQATPEATSEATPEPSPEPPPETGGDAAAAVAAPSTPAPTLGPARTGPLRVFCEAKLEPALFKKSDRQDVVDSLEDLRKAIEKRGVLQLAASRAEADAVVQVLERGREPAVIGMRKVRVRVLLGDGSAELTGQDSLKGFNTWSGAAGGAAKQVESWLLSRRPPSE